MQIATVIAVLVFVLTVLIALMVLDFVRKIPSEGSRTPPPQPVAPPPPPPAPEVKPKRVRKTKKFSPPKTL